MKNIGIWLDKDKAQVVTLEDGKETMTTIESNIDHFHIQGGSGSKFKGGPQDVVQDSKYLEKEKHQFKDYFKAIVEDIKDADAIVLFGPAQTNEKFSKELHNNYNAIATKVKGVRKADSMTDNQVRAWVRGFFESNYFF